MEASSFDDFCLAPPGWSDSSLPESDDCGALLLEAFLSYVDIDAPRHNQPRAHFVGSLCLSQTTMSNERSVARCSKLSQRCSKWI